MKQAEVLVTRVKAIREGMRRLGVRHLSVTRTSKPRPYGFFLVTEQTTPKEFAAAVAGGECNFDYARAQDWRRQLKMAEMYVPILKPD